MKQVTPAEGELSHEICHTASRLQSLKWTTTHMTVCFSLHIIYYIVCENNFSAKAEGGGHVKAPLQEL